MTTTGRLLVASSTTLGSVVIDGAFADESQILVASVLDFAESGGWVKVNDDLVQYDTIDHDTNILTLVTPLPNDALDGDRVDVWEPDQDRPATEIECQVAPDGDDSAADPIFASVEHHLEPLIPLGIGTDTTPVVTMERRGDEWVVTGLLGQTPRVDGGTVWHPHSFRQSFARNIADTTHLQVKQWDNIETDGITFTTATWTIIDPAWYGMTALATWESNPNGRRRLRILLNGLPLEVNVVAADPDDTTSQLVTTNARLAQGDEVEVWAYQSSGGTLQIIESTFSIFRISV